MGSHNDLFELNLECSSSNFKKNFISIIEKFTKLADQGKHADEVDIETLEIVVDKGFLKDAKRKSFGKSLLASELDTSSPSNANKGGSQTNNLSNRQTLPWNFKEIFDNDLNEFCNSKDHDKSLNYEGVIHKKLTYEDIKLDDLLEPSDAESISSSFTEDSNDEDESDDIDCPLSDSLNHNTSTDLKSPSSVASPSTKDDVASKLSNDDIVLSCHKNADGCKPELCQETTGSASVASSSDEINSRNSINLSSTNNNVILQDEDFVEPNESLPCVERSLTEGVLDLRCHKTPSKPDVVISSNDIEQFSGLKQCAIDKSKKRILLSSIENTVHPPTLNRSSLLKEDFQGTLNLNKNSPPDELINPIQILRDVAHRSDEAFHSNEDRIRNLNRKDLKSARDKNSEMLTLLQGRQFKHNVFDPFLNETFKVDSACQCKMHSEICLKMIPNLDSFSCKNDVSPVDNQSKTKRNDSNETFLVNKSGDSALNGARTTVPNTYSGRLFTPKCDFSEVVPEGAKGFFQTSQLLWNAFTGSRNNFSNYRCLNGRRVPVDLKAPPHTFSPLAETVVESEHFIGFVLPKCPQISFEEAPFNTAPLNTNFASSCGASHIAREKTSGDNSVSHSSIFKHDGNAHPNKHPGEASKDATVSNCGNEEASSKCVQDSKSNIHTKNELEVRNLEFSEARKKFLGCLSSTNFDGDFKSGVNNSVVLKNSANIKLSPKLMPSQQEAGLTDKFLQVTTCLEDDKVISHSVDLDLIPDSERICSSVKALNFAKTANNHISKNRRTSYRQLENITNHIPSNRNSLENNIESDGLASFKTPGDSKLNSGKQIKSNLNEPSFSKRLLENKEAFDVARERFFKTRSSFEGTQNNKISSTELSENKTMNVTRNVNKTPAAFTESELIRNRDEEFVEPHTRAETRAVQSHQSSVDNVPRSRGSSKKFVYEKEMRLTEKFNNKEPKNGINKMSTFLIKQKNYKKSTYSNLKPCSNIDDAIEPCSLLYSSSDYESESDTAAEKVSIGDMVKKKEMQPKYISLSTQRMISNLSENNVCEFEKYEEDSLVSTLENPSVIRCAKNKSASKKMLKRKMEYESDSDDVFNISNYSDSLDQLSKKHVVPVEYSRKKLDRLDRKCSYKTRARMNNGKGEVNSGLVLVKERPTSKLFCANDDSNDAFSLTDKQTYSRAGQPRKKKLMVANYI